MRIYTTYNNNNNMELHTYSSHNLDFNSLLFNEFVKPQDFIPLNKHDSFSSVSTADSPQSESPREGSSPSYKSKHQVNLERRHRNFQVKKKTEVNN